jgi:hypothetical protein
MLMVILGAGASHDSTSHFPAGWGMGYPNDEDRTPLTNDLFHSRFQGAMRSFQLLKSLMAVRHYVPRVVGECEERWIGRHAGSNHGTLLSRIDLWCQRYSKRACFVTFNYDTFIEQAFADSTRRIRMRELGEYISDDRYKVIKLHGSVTWFHEVQLPALLDVQQRNADALAQEVIARAPEIRFAKEFLSADRRTIGKIGDHGPGVVSRLILKIERRSSGARPTILRSPRTPGPLVRPVRSGASRQRPGESYG